MFINFLWPVILTATLTASIANNSTRKKLWIGAFFTVDISDGGWSSAGVLPAVEMAIEDVNNSTILQDYELHMEWRDTKCKRGYGIRQLMDLLELPSDKSPIMLIGGGCSVGTEATAEVSHFWNLIQARYPLLFRTCYTESIGNPARIAILKRYGWKNVATVYQNEGLFTLTAIHLREMLDKNNFTVISSENLANDPTFQILNLKQKDARIIIGMFYSAMARKVFCRAYKEGMYGARYLWLIPGWFSDQWWNITDTDCTPAQIKLAAGNYIAIMESTWSTDPRLTINRQTAAELTERYFKRVDATPYTRNEYSVFGYDAVWAVAQTLDKAIPVLRAQGRVLEDFRFNDSSMSALFKSILQGLHYQGMSGEIMFNSKGDRIGSAIVKQLQGDREVKIGTYDSIHGTLILDGPSKLIWQDGAIPVDRMVVKLKLVSVSASLFIVITLFCSIGILLALGFLAFNIHYRERRFIRMSSPRMNSITVIGCIIIYFAALLSGLDGKYLSEDQYSTLCQVKLWTLSVGFTLAYGAMFSKTWRVHVIFLRRIERRSIRDHQLYGIVIALLAVDTALLAAWQVLNPFIRAIKYLPIEKDENGFEAVRPYIEYCSCDHVMEWKGVILAYKGLLLILGAFLAWETRNVTIPALNDSRNIGVSVYTVVLSCVVGLPVVLVVKDMPDFTYGLGACVCIICTTITLCLMFIPKILALGKPEEESSTLQTSRCATKHAKVIPVDTTESTSQRGGNIANESPRISVRVHSADQACVSPSRKQSNHSKSISFVPDCDITSNVSAQDAHLTSRPAVELSEGFRANKDTIVDKNSSSNLKEIQKSQASSLPKIEHGRSLVGNYLSDGENSRQEHRDEQRGVAESLKLAVAGDSLHLESMETEEESRTGENTEQAIHIPTQKETHVSR
ncbi:gamma-aminobutyric acid type B receptor subunit 2 isoform X2 [Nematostella vectensis]|uniref:gamma-aminobutyric acid type B receptor subunit 2 isoform X2 n=1 Tax=Nematostella vectensis TaxID=45351 RepID=UPI00207780D5|nr:gamma-aminobutyric acid type B receptor subunit 2 isoform X2 [Nematostella vectensis]